MEEEFQDMGPVMGQKLLEMADALVAVLPGLSVDQLVDAGDEDILIVRAVEEGDLSLERHMGVDPPEEVVSQLLRGRLLEADHPGALGVEHAEHVIDRPVLAPGVERLQDDEDRVLLLRIEQRLHLRHLLAVVLDLDGGRRLGLVTPLEAGIDFLQLELMARPHTKQVAIMRVLPQTSPP
jgi:hypothetical protein